MYLKRYKPPKMATRESPWWRSERHRKFVRGFVCVVPACDAPIRECCHLRTGTDGAAGVKPSDYHCFPACAEHHRQQHNVGETTFQRMHGIDLPRVIQNINRASPAYREYLRGAAA